MPEADSRVAVCTSRRQHRSDLSFDPPASSHLVVHDNHQLGLSTLPSLIREGLVDHPWTPSGYRTFS